MVLVLEIHSLQTFIYPLLDLFFGTFSEHPQGKCYILSDRKEIEQGAILEKDAHLFPKRHQFLIIKFGHIGSANQYFPRVGFHQSDQVTQQHTFPFPTAPHDHYTFTITNGGIFGSLMSTPILNEPQSAILGMHTIQQRPVTVNGEVQIRPMMYVALSYDHRVIDGSSAVTFLVKVKKLIEDPVKLLLNL